MENKKVLPNWQKKKQKNTATVNINIPSGNTQHILSNSQFSRQSDNKHASNTAGYDSHWPH